MNSIDIHDESIWTPQAPAATYHQAEPSDIADETPEPIYYDREIDHDFLYGYF